ncbi:MAG: GspL/Epsl periplasmic domain-containing protein [Mariprofundaceae bacterium]|nr:GspL/Epsl periplasmic domain-containing protein [Mariprofundaceae bacterium]
MLASWDGVSLELWDDTGARQVVFEPVAGEPSSVADDDGGEAAQENLTQEDRTHEKNDQETAVNRQSDAFGNWSALNISGVEAQASILLLPVELLLQRSFSLPVEHPRFVDVAVLEQELDDQAGVEPQDWWLCWQTARAQDGVRGLIFALPQALKKQLSDAAIGRDCRQVCPDIGVRLQACLPPETGACAVLDADHAGLMLGVVEDGVWRGMRRLNLPKPEDHPQRDKRTIAEDAVHSLRAMGFDVGSQPVFGKLDADWSDAFCGLAEEDGANWHVESMDELPSRHAANGAAFSHLQSDPPFNFRHGRWLLQSDWNVHISAWKRAAVLGIFLVLLLMGHDIYRVQQLSAQQQALRQGVEDVFHQALPGVAMIDPMLQLKQAAGGGADDGAWFFLKQLQAIGQLQGKEKGLAVRGIQYSGKEVVLSGTVADFAVANRVRDALSAILKRKVELVDTDLNGKQVRIRLRWS